MIIALLALAFAMIVGGLLTVFFGWDIVLVERGWTMVISGTIGAASGALLLGITAAVSRLERIHAELARLHVDLGHQETVQEELDEGLIEAAPGTSEGRSFPGISLAALSGGLLGGKMFRRGTPKEEEEQADLPLFENEKRAERADEIVDLEVEQPSSKAADEPFLPFPPRTTPEPSELRDEDAPEIKVPDFLLAERLRETRETYGEARGPSVDIFPYSRDEAAEKHEEEPVAHESRDDLLVKPVEEPVAVSEPEPEPAEEDTASQEPAASEEPRSSATVIGTYNSGDNTYVMFSDGSIEAQTPGGLFRFQSLDELKQFIASGGEGGTAAT